MPIGLAIAGAAVIGGAATVMASNKAASAQKSAVDANLQATRESIASQEAEGEKNRLATAAENDKMIAAVAEQQRISIEAARENIAKALSTVTGEQNNAFDLIQSLQNGSLNLQNVLQDQNIQTALAEKTANTGLWESLRSNLKPYIDAGAGAVANLTDPASHFTVSPDYNFRLKTGLNAVATNKGVNGLLKSGSALKAINNYAQDTASTEYGNWWNRQSGLANMGLNAQGQDAAAVTGNVNTNNTFASSVIDANNNKASAAANTANILSNAAGNKATTIGNAATGAATSLNNVAGDAAAANSSAARSAAAGNTNALADAFARSSAARDSALNTTVNGNNQLATATGNSALTNANAFNGVLGSLVGVLTKYGQGSSTSSSYGAVPWGDSVTPGYTGVVAA